MPCRNHFCARIMVFRMKTKRTIELTVESRSISVLRPARTVLAWCESCGARVLMVTPEEAARRTGVSVRTLYRRLELQTMHFVEMPDSSVLICLDSIS